MFDQFRKFIYFAVIFDISMKQKAIYIGALVAALSGSQAFAQAKNFEGFSFAAGLNIANTTFSRAYAGAAGYSVNGTQANAVAQAHYDYAASEQFVLGFGATADSGKLPFGIWQPSNIEIQMKDRYSVYVAPGYTLNDSTLLYGKLAYITAIVSDPRASELPGVGYGVGLKILAGSHLFYQVELSGTDYAKREYINTKDTFDLKVLTLSIGYKF
jgi:hypothetical protein